MASGSKVVSTKKGDTPWSINRDFTVAFFSIAITITVITVVVCLSKIVNKKIESIINSNTFNNN
jgi:hypothetical protein